MKACTWNSSELPKEYNQGKAGRHLTESSSRLEFSV